MLEQLKKLLGIRSKAERAQVLIAQSVALPPINAIRAVCDWVEQSEYRTLTARDRLQVLHAIDGDLRLILDGAMVAIVEAHFNRTRISLHLLSAITYCKLICLQYTEALTNDPEGITRKNQDANVVQDTAANWLHWVGRYHVVRLLREAKSEQLPWEDIRTIMQLALKFEGRHPDKARNADSAAHRLKNQLSTIALLARTLTTDLQERQILVADRIVSALAAAIHESEGAPTPQTDDVPTVNGPITLITLSLPDAKTLSQGKDKSLLELEALEYLIVVQNKVPEKVDPHGKLDVGETLAVIRHLKNRWMGRVVKRQAERKAVSGKLKLAYDFRAIWNMIAHADDEPANASLANIENCEVEDLSANGISVRLTRHKGWPRIGLLIGLKTGKDLGWRVGIIRRIKSIKHDSTLLGIQFLARSPEAVQVSKHMSASAHGLALESSDWKQKPALYLRPDDGASQDNVHLLVCQKADLEADIDYRLPDTKDGDLRVRVTSLQELGSDAAIYVCQATSMAEDAQPA